MRKTTPRPSAAATPRRGLRAKALAALAAAVATGACLAGGRGERDGGGGPSAADRALAAEFFARGSGDLPEPDRVAIVHALGLRLAHDGTIVDDVCGQPLAPDVRFSDLNADGIWEVFVQLGNTCTSGMAGTSVWVFIRDSGGSYRRNLGFPGIIARVGPATSRGFADLLIGGPGFCFAVWQWDGREYAPARNEPQAPGGCDNR
jgi:hypothetical protein